MISNIFPKKSQNPRSSWIEKKNQALFSSIHLNLRKQPSQPKPVPEAWSSLGFGCGESPKSYRRWAGDEPVMGNDSWSMVIFHSFFVCLPEGLSIWFPHTVLSLIFHDLFNIIYHDIYQMGNIDHYSMRNLFNTNMIYIYYILLYEY